MHDFHVFQDSGYGIGNFINCTPAIQILADHFKTKIPVFFQSEIVKQIFINCSFIKIIDKPEGERLFSSSLVNNQIEDWRYVAEFVISRFNLNISTVPHTSVGKSTYPRLIEEKYCVISRGCAYNPKNAWLFKKDPGEEIYRKIIKSIVDKYRVIIVGSDIDSERLFCFKDLDVTFVLNDIQKTLSLIEHCEFIVANDTGVYHIAGAMNKPVFVLWKDTNFKKNKSPGKYCTFSRKGNWEKDFDIWFTHANNLSSNKI